MTIDEAIDVLNLMKRNYSHIRKSDDEWEAIEMAIDALIAKKKAEIVKTGHWIKKGINHAYYLKCSECGFNCIDASLNYCPHCGSKMIRKETEW